MKFWKHLFLIAAVVVSAGSLSALSFTDVDVDGRDGDPDWVLMAAWNSNQSVKRWDATFDLLSAGFDPATMNVLRATVSFAFSDDYWNRNDPKDRRSRDLEKVNIFVGGQSLWSNLEVDGYHSSTPLTFDWYSQSLNRNLIDKLQTGIVDYSVEAQYGDFYLKEASITVEAERARVADTGTTLLMFGLGVGVLVVLRRQMVKATVA